MVFIIFFFSVKKEHMRDIFPINPLFNPFQFHNNNNVICDDGYGIKSGYLNKINKCICDNYKIELTYYNDNNDERISTCAGIY